MKHIKVALALLSFTTYILTQSPVGQTVDMNFSDFDHEIELLEDLTDNTNWDPNHTRGTQTPSDVLALILAVNGVDILKEDFYKRTNPINKRRIHDMPYFTLHTCTNYCEEDWQYRIEFLYNQTSKQQFTMDSTTVESYLDINRKSLIQQLDDLELEDIDIPRLINIIKGSRLQERRAALMFGAYKNYDCWTFEIKTPLQYQIRNYFLNEKEQRKIREALNQPEETDEEMNFAREHLISDRIGLGDTRINLGYTVINNDTLWLNTGLQTTLATAGLLTTNKGLYGSHFPKEQPRPRFSILEFLNLAVPGTDCSNAIRAEQIGIDFFTQVLDRLSAMTVEDHLAFGRHCGFGLFYETHLHVTEKLTFRSRGDLEYIVPAWEKRFYISKKDCERFERIKTDDPDDPQLAAQNLWFLNQQLLETLFPTMYKTRVHPKFIFHWTGAMSGAIGNYWNVTIGYDLWMQSEEKLKKIDAPITVVQNLKTDISKKTGAYQNKTFVIVEYERSGECYDWCLRLNADTTFLSSGIGKDFNLALGLQLSM